MKTLLLVALLAAATLCLCHADDAGPAKDAPRDAAFVSKRASAELLQRQKRSYGRLDQAFAAAVATRDPFEPYREVCEMNPACDELADHIGFHEAYRRFYGPI